MPDPLLIAAIVLPIPVLIGVVTAVVLRMRDRPIPGWLVNGTAALFGASQSIALVVYATSPILLVPAIVASGLSSWLLLSRGRRAAFGGMLLGLGLPAVAWWVVYFAGAGVAVASEPTGWLWALPAATVSAAGVGFVVVGDRAAPPRRLLSQPPNLARDPIAIAQALQRGHMIGPLPVSTVLVEVPGLVLLSILVPYATRWGMPWPVVLLAGPALYAFAVTELWYPLLGRQRPLWEGFAVGGNRDIRRFREATGGPVPTSDGGIRKWLERNPERPEIRAQRAELLATVGRLDEARDVIARMDTPTAEAHFEQRATAAWIEWLGGAPIDISALREEAELIGTDGSDVRAWARGTVAVLETRDLLARGEPWEGPLTELRRHYGANAATLLREDTYWPRFVRYYGLALLVTGLLLWTGGTVPQAS